MESIFVGQLAALEDEGFFTAKLPGGKDVLILRCSRTRGHRWKKAMSGTR